MSRIGKKPIEIPEGVEVKIEGQRVTIKGPKGELSREIRPEIKVEIKNKKLLVKPWIETPEGKPSASYPSSRAKLATGRSGAGKKTQAFWGLTRILISNMLKGVTEGFEKKLEIEGLGFRASLENDNLLLYVGFSHPVKIKALPGVKFSIEKNIITVSGINKELVGQAAAILRKVRPPEPYKGKGIRYLGEQVRKKVGKKAVTTTK